MQNEFSAVFEQDGDWYIGYCLEVPGANGQGKTLDECRASLREAIKLILDDRRDAALAGVPQEAIRETIDVA
ncbi:MAG: type II toxin-antitoxin system HicB family antitoxin [Planctomycetota bacterium]